MTFSRLILVLIALVSLNLDVAARDRLNDSEKEWLRMVDSIITNKERREFRKKLKTRAERREFIRLFWAKRDPDLDDDKNPFRSEFLARWDFVQTHYNRTRRPYQEFTRATIFLLLGKPSEKRNFVDWSLLGPGYRNPFFEYPPELWTYAEPPYDYKRPKLRVQFIPVNSFGDYAAVTDRITDFWLRDLKNKMIVHPELTEPPPTSRDVDDFQFLVNAEQRRQDSPQPLDVPAPTTVSVDEEDDEDALEVPEVPSVEVTDENLNAADEQAGTLTTEGTVSLTKAETVEVGETVNVDAPRGTTLPGTAAMPEVEETELSVPATTVDEPGTTINVFNRDAGNPMEIQAKLAFFKSGSERSLVIARIGFPLKNLGFQLVESNYRAPFMLDYTLMDSRGVRVAGDGLSDDLLLPSKRIFQDPNRYYSLEFAVILVPDLYTLRVQLKDENTDKVSYFETKLEVPRPNPNKILLSNLSLMDPNVNPEDARFSIRGTPYNLDIAARYAQGERLYPVVELLNLDNLDEVAYIEIQALRNGEAVQAWDLYSEELTETNQRSILLHPVLDTRLLSPGDYSLRFEIELNNGELLLSETAFNLTEAEKK